MDNYIYFCISFYTWSDLPVIWLTTDIHLKLEPYFDNLSYYISDEIPLTPHLSLSHMHYITLKKQIH